MLRFWLGAAVALLPGPAFAHASLAGVGDFYAGLVHPVTDLPAIFPLVALVLLGGRAGRERGLWAALAGAGAAFAGGLAAVRGLVFAPTAAVLAGAVMTIALLVVADWRPPGVLLLALAAVASAALGFEQVAELRSTAFVGGVALAVALTLIYGMDLVGRLRAPWALVAVRVVGSWLVAIQAMMLGLALR